MDENTLRAAALATERQRWFSWRQPDGRQYIARAHGARLNITPIPAGLDADAATDLAACIWVSARDTLLAELVAPRDF